MQFQPNKSCRFHVKSARYGLFRSNYLVERLSAWPGLSARRLHREIKEMGFEGAYSTLTEYLRLIRPTAPRRFERRFETPAGRPAQVDFAEFQVEFTAEPGVTRKVWLFSMVLGHSRWLWGRFCPNQTLETVMRCHIAAFDAMGGACAEVLYDRMKTAVIGEDAAGVVTYNASLVALLAHYGSAPRACQPYRAKTKGKMGEDVTETLGVIPRQWKVVQTVREKFTCRACEKISQAPAPFHPTPRGWAGPNLLAMILFEKFGQHQPLNRQAERYAKEGVEISLSTLADQVGACTVALAPIHALMPVGVFPTRTGSTTAPWTRRR